jgi:hypothetical protein
VTEVRCQGTILLGDESSSSEDEAQRVAGDAATVLEFLARGRLKDSNFTNSETSPSNLREPTMFSGRDNIHSDDALH